MSGWLSRDRIGMGVIGVVAGLILGAMAGAFLTGDRDAGEEASLRAIPFDPAQVCTVDSADALSIDGDTASGLRSWEATHLAVAKAAPPEAASGLASLAAFYGKLANILENPDDGGADAAALIAAGPPEIDEDAVDEFLAEICPDRRT